MGTTTVAERQRELVLSVVSAAESAVALINQSFPVAGGPVPTCGIPTPLEWAALVANLRGTTDRIAKTPWPTWVENGGCCFGPAAWIGNGELLWPPDVLAYIGRIAEGCELAFVAIQDGVAELPVRAVVAMRSGAAQLRQAIVGKQRRETIRQAPADDASTIEEKAIGVLAKNPDLTLKEIAHRIGTNPKYLSDRRHKRFHAARKAIRNADIPRGQKVSGRIEAVGDDDLDFEGMDG